MEGVTTVAFESLAFTDAAAGKSLADVAYASIRDRLLMLDIKPGDLLNDEVLSKDLGVGRTPVREALKRLELDRLVVTYPRRGTFATRVEVTDLAFISEIRAQLEPLAASRAARVASPATRERLRSRDERRLRPLIRERSLGRRNPAPRRQRAPRHLCGCCEPPPGRRPHPLRQPCHPNLVHGFGPASRSLPPCPRAPRPPRVQSLTAMRHGLRSWRVFTSAVSSMLSARLSLPPSLRQRAAGRR